MNSIKVCFWNLQNLFDTTLSDFALDFDYTPTNGWDETVRDIKIDNLVKGISSTFYSGPDLIGMCEIENEYLAQEIATKLNRNLNRNDYSVAKLNVMTIDGYNQNKIETFDHSELAEKGYMQSINDWKNIEMTGYIKLNKFDIDE